jgi:excisionase family DNA binding protein
MQEYMSARETADYLRLSSSTLAKFRVTGGGPAYVKAGRKVLYRRGDLDDWMTTHVRASTSDGASRRTGLKEAPRHQGVRWPHKRWPS